ncbi:Fas apoptotic inhibitory molecule 1, partial [Geodia barretti]
QLKGVELGRYYLHVICWTLCAAQHALKGVYTTSPAASPAMSGERLSGGGRQAGAGIADDVAADWEVGLADGVHRVRLDHGTTSGKRVITVDDKELCRRNWMFSLVGSEKFMISSKPAEIVISCKGFMFEYTLNVDGKSLKKFVESQLKNTRVWHPEINGRGHRVVLDIETMDVYVDGEKMDTHVSIICGSSFYY